MGRLTPQRRGEQAVELVESRPATREDSPALVRVLSRALSDDPFIRWFRTLGAFSAEVFFARQLESWFTRAFPIYTAQECRSVALWNPPGTPLDEVPPGGHPDSSKYLQAMNDACPEITHSELDWIATLPVFEGRGYGGALLRLHLEYCDELGIASALRTNNPASRDWYLRREYKLHRVVQASPAPTGWWLVRPPKLTPTGSI
jgi:GNAT superfamily N-acetyltransferase